MCTYVLHQLITCHRNMSSLNIFFILRLTELKLLRNRKITEIKLSIFEGIFKQTEQLELFKINFNILEDNVKFNPNSWLQFHKTWQLFQTAKISTTCSSNYCFTVTFLSIKHVNANPRGNSLFGFIGDENRMKMGLSSIV